MTALQSGLGLVLVVLALVDLGWTTLAAGSGAGPFTGRLAPVWWRLALAVHRRRPSHVWLATMGTLTSVVVLITWISTVLGGWLLVFTSAEEAVVHADTGDPGDLVDRIYFTGYTVFTLGIGDFSPGAGTWQLATVAATASGLLLVTLAITYLVPVASAVAQRRRLASYVTSLGRSPDQILTRAWGGTDFGALEDHLVALTVELHSALQSHFTYPMLHYFHSREEHSAAAPRLTDLALAVDLLRHGVAPGSRPPPSVLAPIAEAIDLATQALETGPVTPRGRPIDVPSLEPLRVAGIPTVGEDEYRTAVAESHRRRRLLAGYLEDDGRTHHRGAEGPDQTGDLVRRRR